MSIFTYIDTPEQLQEFLKEIKTDKLLAFDIECENNMHHYGVYLSLIQVANKEKVWIIDTLKVKGKELAPLTKIFENPKIKKVFHDISFDFRILNKQLNCQVNNFFDTQLAALFLGKEHIGLTSLLEEYFQVEKERQHQKADWTKRPLPPKMLSYAAKDVEYLLQLYDKLRKELQSKKRLLWIEQELEFQQSKEFTLKEQNYNDLKGYKQLSAEQRGVLRKLFQMRSKLAKEVDRPVHFVIRNKQLIAFATNPPSSWAKVRGTHPIVRKRALQLRKAVQEGKRSPLQVKKTTPKKLPSQKKQQLQLLQERIKEKASKEQIPAYLLLNKEQAIDIIVTEKQDCLRAWQKELLKEILKKTQVKQE